MVLSFPPSHPPLAAHPPTRAPAHPPTLPHRHTHARTGACTHAHAHTHARTHAPTGKRLQLSCIHHIMSIGLFKRSASNPFAFVLRLEP